MTTPPPNADIPAVNLLVGLANILAVVCIGATAYFMNWLGPAFCAGLLAGVILLRIAHKIDAKNAE